MIVRDAEAVRVANHRGLRLQRIGIRRLTLLAAETGRGPFKTHVSILTPEIRQTSATRRRLISI
ncbi:hypothetical protein EP30_04775 [Bifidobacterium sp. UTCIF-39]|nr:hypothetical protein EP30_04775 [Bifidobacterium sp. UTCIF-39]